MKWMTILISLLIIGCKPVVDVDDDELSARIELEINQVFSMNPLTEQLEFSQLELSEELVCLEGLEFDCPGGGPIISPVPVSYKDYDIYVDGVVINKKISDTELDILPQLTITLQRNGDYELTTSYHPESIFPSTNLNLSEIGLNTGVVYLDILSEDYEFTQADVESSQCYLLKTILPFNNETSLVELDTNLFWERLEEGTSCIVNFNFTWQSNNGVVSPEYKDGKFELLYKLTLEVEISNAMES